VEQLLAFELPRLRFLSRHKKDKISSAQYTFLVQPLHDDGVTNSTDLFNMAPMKRKGDTANVADTKEARKKVRVVAEGESKALKPARGSNSASTTHTKRTPSETHKSANQPLKSSIFREEEASFPRGGGSILTPLEKKQIQAQANRDVLFEQQSLGQQDRLCSDDENEEQDRGPSKSVERARKSRRSSKSRPTRDTEPAGVKVESLNFKVRAFRGDNKLPRG